MHQEFLKLVTRKFSQLYHASIDHFIAPPFCAYCKKFLSQRMILCVDCFESIQPIVSVQLTVTKTQSITVLAVSGYQEPLKTLILSKAWSDITACNQLAQLIWENTYFKHRPCDYMIPVPLHWMRKAKRGYNQAEEIAQSLALYRHAEVANIISRVKNTPFQSSLAFDKRLDNVKHAFILKTSIDKALYENKHLILVDDLMTTGSTLAACAKQLMQLKPASITAVVVSRVV